MAEATQKQVKSNWDTLFAIFPRMTKDADGNSVPLLNDRGEQRWSVMAPEADGKLVLIEDVAFFKVYDKEQKDKFKCYRLARSSRERSRRTTFNDIKEQMFGSK
jgi:hypothetical protein